MIYSMPLEKLDSFFESVAGSQILYLPVADKDGVTTYEKWEPGKKYSAALNTLRSAKDFFFPQTQNLVDFKTEGKNIEILDERSESEDFTVFGVRACDVKSFEVLDRVFLADPVDTFYQTRREHSTVISMACTRPEETCFCHTFDIDAVAPMGDIRCHMTGDTLFLEVLTQKGEKLISSLGTLVKETGETEPAEIKKQKEETEAILKKLPLYELRTDDFTDRQLDVFNSPKWAKLSEACIGCGACTFVCPTCQCFDIKDFNTGHGIKRFRCWDSCMYSDFTLMAAANPRHTQLERFRQRFMHKLVYYPKDHDGLFSCVGCGRCLRKCPISMNIVKVMKSIGGEK